MFCRSSKSWCALVALVLVAACSSDDDGEDGEDGAGAGGRDAGSDSGSGGTSAADAMQPVQPFNGDCSTAKWGNVSDACWACACEICEAQLNECDETCVGVMECALDEHCLVGSLSEISCEVTCAQTICSSGDAFGAAATFDTCLIGAATAPAFRACEQECGIAYTGDVCERFPASAADAAAP